ncbi:MAG: GHKL domain-containing protein [Bacteroidales bacterium]|nr:GHKL domain-containing protein [Lachnoclostridium sp.]MCM1384230.1 GHKL domain-containing protein [Lachnoclostridium sp.]MCM1464730.1 GHKL domain-containing protein [Bacteroidales bacterium]
MTILRDLSMLWSLFHILILFMLLYRSRYPRKKTILLTGICMGPLILLNVAGLVLYGAELMGKVFVLTCTLPSFFFFWFMSKDKKGKFFFTFCLADTVAFWIVAVTNIVDFYLGGQQYVLMLLGRLVLFPLAEWAAARYLRKPYMELQESVAKGWGLFAGMTALYYILLIISSNFPLVITRRPQELPTFLLILLLMPMTYATIFAAMYRQLLLYRKQQSGLILQEQKNMLSTQLENQRQIRKMKHDMKGHMITLSGLLAAGQMKEAQEYLKSIETEMSVLPGQFCANPYLNAVLTQYAGKMDKLGVKYSINIQVGDEPLPYMELCQILSNGLENACDALQGLPVERRQASVQMKYNRNYLLIRIRNCCREDLHVENGTIPATDKEGHDHGFGLSTVQEAAGRLDGEMFCYTENGCFILNVMISCHSFSKEGYGKTEE